MSFSPPLIEIPRERGDSIPKPEEQAAAIAAVEQGGVVCFPRLAFEFEPEARGLLSTERSDNKPKNISLDSRTQTLSGARGTPADIAMLNRMLRRFGDYARGLIAGVF